MPVSKQIGDGQPSTLKFKFSDTDLDTNKVESEGISHLAKSLWKQLNIIYFGNNITT